MNKKYYTILANLLNLLHIANEKKLIEHLVSKGYRRGSLGSLKARGYFTAKAIDKISELTGLSVDEIKEGQQGRKNIFNERQKQKMEENNGKNLIDQDLQDAQEKLAKLWEIRPLKKFILKTLDDLEIMAQEIYDTGRKQRPLKDTGTEGSP